MLTNKQLSEQLRPRVTSAATRLLDDTIPPLSLSRFQHLKRIFLQLSANQLVRFFNLPADHGVFNLPTENDTFLVGFDSQEAFIRMEPDAVHDIFIVHAHIKNFIHLNNIRNFLSVCTDLTYLLLTILIPPPNGDLLLTFPYMSRLRFLHLASETTTRLPLAFLTPNLQELYVSAARLIDVYLPATLDKICFGVMASQQLHLSPMPNVRTISLTNVDIQLDLSDRNFPKLQILRLYNCSFQSHPPMTLARSILAHSALKNVTIVHHPDNDQQIYQWMQFQTFLNAVGSVDESVHLDVWVPSARSALLR